MIDRFLLYLMGRECIFVVSLSITSLLVFDLLIRQLFKITLSKLVFCYFFPSILLVVDVKKFASRLTSRILHSVCLISPWSSRHRCSPINQLSKAIWGDTKFWLSFSPVLFFEMAEPLTCRFKTFRESDLWADLTFQLSFIFFHRTLWFFYSVMHLVINCYPIGSLASKILMTLQDPYSRLKCIVLFFSWLYPASFYTEFKCLEIVVSGGSGWSSEYLKS